MLLEPCTKPSKSSSSATTQSPGNYPIAWELPVPGESQASSQLSDLPSEMFDSQPSVSDSGFPLPNEGLKRQFVAFVEERMRGARGDSDPEAEFCNPETERKKKEHAERLPRLVGHRL